VEVSYQPGSVEIEVVDDGRGMRDTRWDTAGGHGLAGMRERAQLFDGAFEAGPRPSGGFAVRVVLPSDPSPAAG
jgi:signal transduction histidine kinase